jgi:hypothetical protein
MHQRAPVDVGQVRVSQLKCSFSCVFLSPSFARFLRRGGAIPLFFTALEATPPEIPVQRYDSMSESLQRPGAGVRRGHARFAF